MTRPISLRTAWFAAFAAALAIAPLRANAASPIHVQWEGLSIVAGKTVSVAMPGGSVITGKAAGVSPDALLVDVKTTTDPKAWPKGLVRVPRATLHRLDMRTKGKVFRVLGTVLGAAAGLIGGAFAAVTILGGILSNHHEGAAVAAFAGISAGTAMLGYFAGNAADKRWTPVEIEP